MSKRALTALLAFVAIAVAVATVVLARSETAPTLSREDLLAYQAAIHPPLAEARPAIDGLRADPRGSATALLQARNEVAGVEPPESLRGVERLFLRALDQYLSAAGLFGNGKNDDGAAAAEAAGRAYDEASRALQDWRRRLGLGPTAEFPDPEPR